MKPKLVILPPAEADISEAYLWYEARSAGLGSEFLRAVDACLAAVERNPRSYPVVHKEVRRALPRRFPFATFYVIEGERIAVVALLHARRDRKEIEKRASRDLP
ncbi:MAG: type II toxin-antitoxin system RelE/ParE family toxin [Acidobacteria bacterium]|nr:type II toxin-antitoxin system RelE/ParE family toxin [Acidobacteriota bacterium]